MHLGPAGHGEWMIPVSTGIAVGRFQAGEDLAAGMHTAVDCKWLIFPWRHMRAPQTRMSRDSQSGEVPQPVSCCPVTFGHVYSSPLMFADPLFTILRHLRSVTTHVVATLSCCLFLLRSRLPQLKVMIESGNSAPQTAVIAVVRRLILRLKIHR